MRPSPHQLHAGPFQSVHGTAANIIAHCALCGACAPLVYDMAKYYDNVQVGIKCYLRHSTAVWAEWPAMSWRRCELRMGYRANRDLPSHSVFFIPLLFMRRCRFLTLGVSILPSVPFNSEDEMVLFEIIIASSLLKGNSINSGKVRKWDTVHVSPLQIHRVNCRVLGTN
jgi:hypothetical protein